MITNNNKHIISNEIVGIRKLFLSFITFSSPEFISTVHVIFVGIVFVRFVDTLSLTFIISLHTITESSETFFKYLLFS